MGASCSKSKSQGELHPVAQSKRIRLGNVTYSCGHLKEQKYVIEGVI